MTDFELTKNNGEVWEFRGISVDAVDQVREALRRDVPDLTNNEIRQIGSKFWNNFVTYGVTQRPPKSIILEHPRTQETIYTIQRVVRNREQERRIPFGELVLKTAGEAPASNPTGPGEDEGPIQAAQPRRPRTLGEEVPNRSKDEPQPTRSKKEIRAIAKEDNKEETKDNPSLPGGKKRKTRKHKQRRRKTRKNINSTP